MTRRGLGWRIFMAGFGALMSVAGLAITVVGLAAAADPAARAVLCFGLVLVVVGLGGIAWVYAERQHLRHPPVPVLAPAPTGEDALRLPRSPGRSQVSSGVLTGLAAVTGLGAVLAAVSGSWPGAVVLALLAAGLLAVASPGAAGSGAGGLWASPARLVHVHDGVRWEVPWEDVTGVVPADPMPVLLRPGAAPTLRRGVAAGRARVRAWRRSLDGDVLAVETRYLAGGHVLASYVIGKALADRDFRAALGAPASLPPAEKVGPR